MKATFCCEERYAEISIVCKNNEDYKKVEEVTAEAIKELDLHPDILIRQGSHSDGLELCVEFPDDYDHEAGRLIDLLQERLNLEFAPCETRND